MKPPQSYETQENVAGSEEIKNNALEWSGPYSFSDTAIIFEPSSSAELPVVPIGVSIIVILAILIALYLVVKNNKKDRKIDDIDKWNTNELKTEGEKIVDILENNDGRVKQKNIESKLDWSKSKISRVTSDLEEKNVIEKLTIGRENVLNLKKDAKEN